MRIVAWAMGASLAIAACASPSPTVTADNGGSPPSSDLTDAVVLGERPLSISESVARFLDTGHGIDLSGLGDGLESCAALAAGEFSVLLGQPVEHEISYHLANIEPSAYDRQCVLFAAQDRSVEVLHINILNDTDRFVRWNIRNSQRRALPGGIAPVANLGEGGDEFTTVEFEANGVRLIVEARNWEAGIIFAPTPLLDVLKIAELAAQKFRSATPLPETSVLADCEQLDLFRFGELVDGELNGFAASTYDEGLACTAEATSGDRVQILVREFPTMLDTAAEVTSLTDAYRATSRPPQPLRSTTADAAWSFDRVYDDDPSAAGQTTLIESFGHRGTTFFRISFRVATSRRQLFDESLSMATNAVLLGSWAEPRTADPTPSQDSGGQVAAVADFLAAGGNIEVAPMVRGLHSCAELDTEPFEVIAGAELAVVDLGDASEKSPTVVECAMIRDDDGATEMIVRVSSTPDGTAAWTGSVSLDDLSPIDGIDDHAFWNGPDGEWLRLYIEEFDARLLVELANHSYTDEVNVFWIANAFAKALLAG